MFFASKQAFWIKCISGVPSKNGLIFFPGTRLLPSLIGIKATVFIFVFLLLYVQRSHITRYYLITLTNSLLLLGVKILVAPNTSLNLVKKSSKCSSLVINGGFFIIL